MKKIVLCILFASAFNSTFSQNIIEGNNRFSFNMYKLLSQSNKNLIFSPVSITSALAMTYAGAKTNTFEEIANTFYFNKNLNEFNKSYSQLITYDSNKKGSVRLFNANSLWIQNNLKIKQDFLDAHKRFYSSSLFFTDFLGKPENSRLKINQWVKEHTENKIEDLLKPSSIDNGTKLVLVNALYFKGLWNKKFNINKNTEEGFQLGKKEYVKVPFMNNKIIAFYYKDKYSEIIDIPYSDNEFFLTIILPKSYKKLKQLEKKLGYGYYKEFSENSKKLYINLSIPKFNIESEFDLEKTLYRLGMKDAFTSSANFSGISENENLFISKVVHKATIKIDENGTEAAAATAVVMRKTASLLDTIDMKVNRPFIFMIRNRKTNTIYFIGKIVNPL